MVELPESGWFWIALVLLGVLVFNVGLIYGLLSGSLQRQVEILRRLAQRARHPWQREDEALADLHNRAGRLRQQAEETPENG